MTHGFFLLKTLSLLQAGQLIKVHILINTLTAATFLKDPTFHKDRLYTTVNIHVGGRFFFTNLNKFKQNNSVEKPDETKKNQS